MSERILLAIASVLAVFVLALALFWQPALPERALPAPALPAGGDFTLESARGPVALHDYRGKLMLIYFGYTYCPDVCPTSLAATADGLKKLQPDELARVGMFFISVDPQRDTPARLKDYAEFFHPSIVGLTGTPDQLSEIARRYGVFYARQPTNTAGGYVVDHSSETYIVDRDGRLVGKIAHATPPDKVAETLRKYLNQP
ncbi:MAG: SCO family protein [Azonexus sp.]